MLGETIGNFVVESRLGRGGMGEVYLAKHKDLATFVAVKVLNEDISADHDHVNRFFNEARIVSRIRHAGTIKIFDSGFLNGRAYLVMELLEGESLQARLKGRGSLPIPQLVDIARQIASVLDATHKAGVIHRDLKPDNIFIIGDDERASRERVKVLDFGIAKLSGTLASGSPQTVGTMGTPQYMAPEQWRDTSLVDWPADAYALGCVMFEMACGRPPFIATSIPEAYTKHTQDPPPSPRALRPAIPIELERLILRLLEKQPAARARSMAEVATELDAIAAIPPSAVAVDSTMPAVVPVAAQTVATLAPASATPAMTSTTLGGTAAEIQPRPVRPARGMRALIAVGAAIVVATIAVVATRGGSSSVDDNAAAPVAGSAAIPAAPHAAVQPSVQLSSPALQAPPVDARPAEPSVAIDPRKHDPAQRDPKTARPPRPPPAAPAVAPPPTPQATPPSPTPKGSDDELGGRL